MSRSTLFLLIIAVLLTIEAAIFEREPPPWVGAGKVFPGLESGDILEVEITRPSVEGDAALGIDARPVRLRHEGEPAAWWIVEPLRFRALHPRVMGMVYELIDLVRIAEAPPEEDAFPRGPELVVKFRTRSQGDKVVEVGRDHPDGSLDFCYVRVGGEVFVTRKGIRRTFTFSLNDLRSRALFPIAAVDADLLKVSGDPAAAKTIEREGASPRWRLRAPLDALADRELTEDLIRELNSWTIAEFEKDGATTPADLEPFGLSTPAAAVSVRARGGESVTLEIGKEFKAGTTGMVHVRHAGAPFVFSATSEVLDQVLASPEKFRSRYVFDLGLDEIVELRFSGGGHDFRLRRLEPPTTREKLAGESKGDPRPSWEVLDLSGGSSVPGDPQRADGAAIELRQLLVQKFVGPEVSLESIGLAPPWGRIESLTSSGERGSLLVGTRCEDAEFASVLAYHVAREGEPGSYIVATKLVGLWTEGSSAFRKRDISELDRSELAEFEVRDGGTSWYLGRIPGEPWGLSDDTPVARGKTLDSSVVEQLLAALDRSYFTVGRYLPGLADPSRVGLDVMVPRRGIVFLRPDDMAGFRKLVIGDKVEGSEPPEVYARVDRDDLPPFTLVADDVPRLFEALVAHLKDITSS